MDLDCYEINALWQDEPIKHCIDPLAEAEDVETAVGKVIPLFPLSRMLHHNPHILIGAPIFPRRSLVGVVRA